MTTLRAIPTSSPEASSGAPRATPPAWLRGLGTATPPLRWRQPEVGEVLAGLWGLRDEALERWRRICARSGVDTRCGVMPPEEAIGLTTGARMTAYERYAPALGADAARHALDDAGVDAKRVTDLVVVSCTGFAAPGLDVSLVTDLGLSETVRRTCVGFMGCFGALTGLRVAAGQCAADPDAVVLVVCVELCSLHVRDDPSGDNLVASALFGDGAAAAVVGPGAADTSDAGPPRGRLTLGSSLLVPEGRDWMSWRITDHGFAMTLSREVPAVVRRRLRALPEGQGRRWVVVHPGGPGILDAVEDGLDLQDGEGLEISRDILRRFGNMSSGTVLFVLAEAMRRSHRPPATMLAFGPGLTIERLELL